MSIGKIKAFIFMFLMDVEDYTEKIVAAQTKINGKTRMVQLLLIFFLFLFFLKWFINLKCRQLLCKELKFEQFFIIFILIENGKSF